MGFCFCAYLTDSLSEALKAISVSTELIEEELKPHLDTVLAVLLEKSRSCNIQIQTCTDLHYYIHMECDMNSLHQLVTHKYCVINKISEHGTGGRFSPHCPNSKENIKKHLRPENMPYLFIISQKYENAQSNT